ncbi:MAG: 50S ribosomal protein L31e [Candidatus Micrarchaeota archaeon]
MKLERIYTIPLRKAYETVRRKRVPRAVKILREFIGRHMKADGERILISKGLNAHLWVRSIMKPPRRVKVRLIKDEGVIRAYLHDEKIEEPKKTVKGAEGKKETPKAEAKGVTAAPKPEAKGVAAKPEARHAPTEAPIHAEQPKEAKKEHK